uniref:Uncharacterized protein n=1 Tax=Vibrio vulnificus TaxID=672 RepID=A0A9P1JDV5_VIBVL|nr:hypothetical protein [Vibrio vulnificus]CAL25549.1 hypothetical protein [Vibrio vulnificus]
MVLGLFDFSGQTMNPQFTQDQKKDQMLKFEAQKSRSHAGERLLCECYLVRLRV